MTERSNKFWRLHRDNAVAIAAIIGTIAAIGGAVFAYLQLSNQTSAQKKAEVQGQAEDISAVAIGEDGARFNKEPYVAGTRIGIYNKSSTPVNHVVVTLVTNDRSGLGLESEQKRESQRYVRALPPGEFEVEVSAGWHGMSAQPGVELAFEDQSGRSWLRRATGTLVQIHDPVSYYGLPNPMDWGSAVPLRGG
jgi:hypothetical protein